MRPVRRPRVLHQFAVRLAPLWIAAATGFGPLCARALLAQAAGARPAAGAVTGAVRDSVTGRPLVGAVVLLRDSLDRTLGEAVTNEGGRYYLARAAGARRIRVLRMGFRPVEAPLAPSGAAPGEVALAPVPPLLAPVRVVAGAHCPKRTNDAAALGLLEQVRAGLLATVIARTQQPTVLTVLAYERQFEPQDEEGTRIARQAVHVRDATAALAPFGASRSGAEFVADGFRGAGDNAARFYAPDAETLVDDDFVAGYCFRVVAADGGRPHEVGLGFAAARPRAGRVDVDGVLWVDTVARALRTLTFQYAGLDPRVTGLRPGGSLTFRETHTGVAFIDRWALRLVSGGDAPGGAPASSAYGVAGYGGAAGGPRLVVQEVGGELARVAWPDGHVWRAPLGTVRVRLTDPRGQPAFGAVARLEGTEYTGTADASGTVVLADVLPGPYTLTAADPRLATRRRGRPAMVRLVAERDGAVDARLVVEMAPQVAVADTSAAGRARRRAPDTSSVAIGAGKTVERLFTGRFPGVEVTASDAGGLRIRIRGGATSFMSGEEPLYVVDGTPVPQGTGGIVYLNPYDIERIEVLKNAEDVGIYGVRGGNGVIRITTTRPPGTRRP